MLDRVIYQQLSNKIENRLSKRLRDTEFSQREISRLIENLTSKVDSLWNPTSEQSGSALRFDLDAGPVGDSDSNDISRNLTSNSRFENRVLRWKKY